MNEDVETNVVNDEPMTPGAYNTMRGMDFGHALKLLKRGERVARSGWNGKDMFIFLVPGSTFEVNRAPLLGIYPEGTVIDYRDRLDMRTADGQIVPWVASQTDVLASDWCLVPRSAFVEGGE